VKYHTALRSALLISLVLAAVSACSYVAEDKALEQKLDSLTPNGQHLALEALTDFSWDTLFIFGPYESGSAVNKAVGGDVLPGGHTVGEFENLLVFSLGGSPVRQATVLDMFEWGTRREWPVTVELIPTARCRVVLHLPGDPEPAASCYGSA
jgi:hypothetical protein